MQRQKRAAHDHMRRIGRPGAPADVVQDRRGEKRGQHQEDGDPPPAEPQPRLGRKPPDPEPREHAQRDRDFRHHHRDRHPFAPVLRLQVQRGNHSGSVM